MAEFGKGVSVTPEELDMLWDEHYLEFSIHKTGEQRPTLDGEPAPVSAVLLRHVTQPFLHAERDACRCGMQSIPPKEAEPDEVRAIYIPSALDKLPDSHIGTRTKVFLGWLIRNSMDSANGDAS